MREARNVKGEESSMKSEESRVKGEESRGKTGTQMRKLWDCGFPAAVYRTQPSNNRVNYPQTGKIQKNQSQE